jgi:N-acetylneuraminic acid mutarotase
MGIARQDFGLTSLNNKLYAVGGTDDDRNPLASMEVYDPSTDTWTAGKANMGTSRDSFGLASLNNKLYAVGGFYGRRPFGPLASMGVYDPSTDTWAAGENMITARWGFGLASLNNKLYAVGGDKCCSDPPNSRRGGQDWHDNILASMERLALASVAM